MLMQIQCEQNCVYTLKFVILPFYQSNIFEMIALLRAGKLRW